MDRFNADRAVQGIIPAVQNNGRSINGRSFNRQETAQEPPLD
ncbi:hypothetical protein L248_0856 [Schleiferilactobacillus shenzhenensis LY-73]|uniref:Uncharacterized protein n=1 Tax=Schleiferilactobacillus shenzhenensis LY-73 TaxID=1231336 RepID=U4TID0_9LACO|nr:hypothetical protein L248_0856 [Schleiferilactobacillus shenzhenensis LY-73]